MIYFIITAMVILGICSGLIVAILSEDQSKNTGAGVKPAWKQRQSEESPVKPSESLSRDRQGVGKG